MLQNFITTDRYFSNDKLDKKFVKVCFEHVHNQFYWKTIDVLKSNLTINRCDDVNWKRYLQIYLIKAIHTEDLKLLLGINIINWKRPGLSGYFSLIQKENVIEVWDSSRVVRMQKPEATNTYKLWW